MVKSFVEAHGGRIEVQSSTTEPHRGTTFTVFLTAIAAPE
jgi:signal transduction histidine kinase